MIRISLISSDLQHEIFRLLLDGNYALAPIQDARHVLDVATGTGIWACHFGEQNPHVHVVGTDLSRIQPYGRHSNVEFVREDSEDTWIFPYKFDYVHLRAVVTCFEDTRVVMQRAFDHMNEGAWIEFQDPVLNLYAIDDSLRGTALEAWVQYVRLGFAAASRDMDKPKLYAQWLGEIGFVDVKEVGMPIPINQWSTGSKYQKIGQFNYWNMKKVIPAFATKTFPAAGLSDAQTRAIVDQALLDLGNTDIHAYCPIHIICARRPTELELQGAV